MNKFKMALAVALAIVVFGGTPAHGDELPVGEPPGYDPYVPCTEDMACWDCETMGDHVCGDDRWVKVTQNRNGAITISRQSPQVASNRFYFGRGFVCLTVARAEDGTIRRFRVCHA